MKTLSAFCLMLAAIAPALAQPVQVNESEFAVPATDMQRIVENFNQPRPLPLPSPLPLANGQFVGSASGSAPWCVPSPCMTLNLGGGTFSGFPSGTRLWSARIIPATGTSNIYDFEVVGHSGAQQFSVTGIPWSLNGGFVGFHDPRGLVSVRVTLRPVLPLFGYSVDNVEVAVSADRPLPVPTLSVVGGWLLALSLLSIGGWLTRCR